MPRNSQLVEMVKYWLKGNFTKQYARNIINKINRQVYRDFLQAQAIV